MLNNNYKVNYVNAQVRNAGRRVGRRQICVSGQGIYHGMLCWQLPFSSHPLVPNKLALCSLETLLKCTPGVSADAFHRFKLEILRIFAKAVKIELFTQEASRMISSTLIITSPPKPSPPIYKNGNIR